MKSGWITAPTASAILALCLTACSAGAASPSGTGPARSTAPPATGVSSAPPASARSGGLTPPGTHLGFGQEATVGWVPLSTTSGPSLRLQVTVESIEKGSIADFRNVDLNASESKSTPYYVKVRIKALSSTAPSGTDDPAITLNAIDDRGQQQESITFLGTFQRCNDNTPPKPFASGKSYESCLAYLMPGGGSIQSVQWNDGPAAANQVTPYFDHPIVWAAG
jgi:hypothetical protein